MHKKFRSVDSHTYPLQTHNHDFGQGGWAEISVSCKNGHLLKKWAFIREKLYKKNIFGEILITFELLH